MDHIHHNSIHALAVEMYKVDTNMSANIVNGVFKLKNTPNYNLRLTSHFFTDLIHSTCNGTGSASYLRPHIWEQITAEIENKDSLDGFKK